MHNQVGQHAGASGHTRVMEPHCPAIGSTADLFTSEPMHSHTCIVEPVGWMPTMMGFQMELHLTPRVLPWLRNLHPCCRVDDTPVVQQARKRKRQHATPTIDNKSQIQTHPTQINRITPETHATHLPQHHYPTAHHRKTQVLLLPIAVPRHPQLHCEQAVGSHRHG